MERAPEVIEVPDLVGLAVGRAQDAALDAGVLAVDAESGGPPAKDATVRRQRPRAGRRIVRGGRVRVWVTAEDDDGGGGGGGGGDRSPLGPRPLLWTGAS